MAIPSLVWLAIGTLVTIMSLRLGDKFTLFLIAGPILIIIGIGKALVWFVLRQKKPVHMTPQHAQKLSQKGAHPARHAVAVPPSLRQSYYTCARCRTVILPASNYCITCGLKIQ